MRLPRLAMLCVAALSASACGSDSVTAPPQLAAVRFVNAVADTGAVDIRYIDQVDFSTAGNNVAFRGGTPYFPAAVGTRKLRVFLTSRDITVTSVTMLDAQATLAANARVTLLLSGSARAGTLKLLVVNDSTTAPPSGQIGIRMVNATSGQVSDGYISTAPSDPLSGSPTFTGVQALASSAYANRATGAAALQVTATGSITVSARSAGPPAPATLPGEFPAAGVTSAGSMFSAYYFPASVVGSGAPQTAAFQVPGIVWFVDRNPCDAPAVAGCGS
jgi:hypothetical protein